MKNKKLLSVLIGFSIMPSIIMPLTTTSCGSEQSSKNKIKLVGEAEVTLDTEVETTYKFKLENALADGEQLSCEATNIESPRDVTVNIDDHIEVETGKTDFSVNVTITKEGSLINNDNVSFGLVFKGQKNGKQTFTSEVSGLKITYIDDVKMIPLDKLVIKDGVLYGLNCTWDDEEIADCDTIFIPNNVVEICQDQYHVAKTKLTNLPSIEKGETGPDLKIIKFEDGSKPLFLNNSAFHQLAGVETVVLPKRLSCLGQYCFQFAAHLKEINIESWDSEKFNSGNPFGISDIFTDLPEGVGKIILCDDDSVNADAYYTFTAIDEKFANWEGITPPDQQDVIEGNFKYDVYGDKNIITDYVGEDKETIETLEIPTWCNAIKPLAFVKNTLGSLTTTLPGLETIQVASGAKLEKIYAGAFVDTQATDVHLENATNLKHLDNGVFYGSSIKSIQFPTSLETISPNCFNSCHSLAKIDLRKTQVKKISFGTFAECGQLAEVALPNITWIGAYAFKYCVKLETTFDFTDAFSHVTYIGANAFDSCATSKFIFPKADKSSDLSYIGQEAFRATMTDDTDPAKYVDIYLPSSIEYICDGAFSYNPAIRQIFVSKSNKNYRAENGYLYNSNNELLFVAAEAGEVPTNIETIRPLAVAGMKLVNDKLDLSNTAIKTIGGSAFAGAYTTTGYMISLPRSVTSIGEKAFAGSNDDAKPGLANINLDELENLTELGEGCFEHCEKLTKISFPSGLTEIKSQCFMGSGVEQVTIPNSITKIRNQAFYSCTLDYIDLYAYTTVPDKWADPNAFGSLKAKSEKITVYINNPDLETAWKTQFLAGTAPVGNLVFVVGEPE